ncbi:MAG: Calcium-transporting ATPase, partial [Acidimicrobiales bacterium]|nr:Calcium-transporting ATPase [Acidimicrobiales bacterium]
IGGAVVTAAGVVRGVPTRAAVQSGVSLAVAAVPEGLPLLATMAQISAARRLAARGVLVRNPRAVEALGRVDVLLADKTGTLTMGQIRLTGVSDGTTDAALDQLADRHRDILVAALRASPAEREAHDPLPHLTDRAVVDGALALGVTATNGQDWQRADELPFEPARGYHAVLGRDRDGDVLSAKGAPEVVLPRCRAWDDGRGAREMSAELQRDLYAHVEQLARQGYRVLAVAERRASGRGDLDDERVDRLVLLGFVALSDPVRPAAAAAVEQLRQAGVRTVMATGDHPSTAEGIAHELSLLDGGSVVTGSELDALNDDQLAAALPDVSVFARVTPAQKLRLVAAYQAAGHGIAMIGDGANDAPAIRNADVGVALGEHGTSGARRAADLVVPGNKIEVLLDAVIEGRAMWVSVREAVAILLGGNLGEMAFTVAGAAVSGRSPLNPRQLLLVNLLTDAVPAMAIATRAPRDVSPEVLLAEGPDASLGRSLERAIVARACTTAGSAGGAWVAARMTGRGARASTVALAALVGTQLAQTVLSGGRDPVVLAAALGSWVALVATIQTPGVSGVFGCTPLGPIGWTTAGAASAAGLAASPLVARAVAVLLPAA